MRMQLLGEFSAVRELIQFTLAIGSVITSTYPTWLSASAALKKPLLTLEFVKLPYPVVVSF